MADLKMYMDEAYDMFYDMYYLGNKKRMKDLKRAMDNYSVARTNKKKKSKNVFDKTSDKS